jgi:hypothetical protein
MENTTTIQTVKKQVNENNELIGYIANNKSIPICESNRDYQDVLKYIEDGGTVEEAYTDEELANIELAKAKAEAQAYLDSTDYINDKYKEEVELFKTISAENFLDKYSEIYNKRKECREVL